MTILYGGHDIKVDNTRLLCVRLPVYSTLFNKKENENEKKLLKRKTIPRKILLLFCDRNKLKFNADYYFGVENKLLRNVICNQY